jgi:hypothetical protein
LSCVTGVITRIQSAQRDPLGGQQPAELVGDRGLDHRVREAVRARRHRLASPQFVRYVHGDPVQVPVARTDERAQLAPNAAAERGGLRRQQPGDRGRERRLAATGLTDDRELILGPCSLRRPDVHPPFTTQRLNMKSLCVCYVSG